MKFAVQYLQSAGGWNKVLPPTIALSPTHGWNACRLFLASLFSEMPLNPPGGLMRRCVLRCLLPAFFAVLSAVPAAANPINVGSFYFFGDEFFEYFVLDNNADGSLATLTFSAVIQIDGADYADQFDPSPIGSGGSVFSSGLFPITPFTDGGKASLVFTSNAASFGGSLSLSNLLFDDLDSSDGYSPSFTASVQFNEDAPSTVAETPSWFVVAIGLGALAVGRALLS